MLWPDLDSASSALFTLPIRIWSNFTKLSMRIYPPLVCIKSGIWASGWCRKVCKFWTITEHAQFESFFREDMIFKMIIFEPFICIEMKIQLRQFETIYNVFIIYSASHSPVFAQQIRHRTRNWYEAMKIGFSIGPLSWTFVYQWWTGLTNINMV